MNVELLKRERRVRINRICRFPFRVWRKTRCKISQIGGFCVTSLPLSVCGNKRSHISFFCSSASNCISHNCRLDSKESAATHLSALYLSRIHKSKYLKNYVSKHWSRQSLALFLYLQAIFFCKLFIFVGDSVTVRTLKSSFYYISRANFM